MRIADDVEVGRQAKAIERALDGAVGVRGDGDGQAQPPNTFERRNDVLRHFLPEIVDGMVRADFSKGLEGLVAQRHTGRREHTFQIVAPSFGIGRGGDAHERVDGELHGRFGGPQGVNGGVDAVALERFADASPVRNNQHAAGIE